MLSLLFASFHRRFLYTGLFVTLGGGRKPAWHTATLSLGGLGWCLGWGALQGLAWLSQYQLCHGVAQPNKVQETLVAGKSCHACSLGACLLPHTAAHTQLLKTEMPNKVEGLSSACLFHTACYHNAHPPGMVVWRRLINMLMLHIGFTLICLFVFLAFGLGTPPVLLFLSGFVPGLPHSFGCCLAHMLYCHCHHTCHTFGRHAW